MDYKVTFSAQSQRDLFAIVSFLADKNPAAARKLGDSLLDDRAEANSEQRSG